MARHSDFGLREGGCRVPEKNEEVVRLLKAHGAMAKGTFGKVEGKGKRVERVEEDVE